VKIILRIVLALMLLVVLGVAGLFALYESNRIVVADIGKARVVDTRVEPGIDTALAQQASAAMESLRQLGGYPAVSAAVAVKGHIVWQEARGWAVVETQAPASIDTSFAIGSVSKALTAAVAMKLAERGVLNLDADIRTYVPSFPKKDYGITARQLLSHQAGIRHYRFVPSPPTFSEMGSTTQYNTTVESLGAFAQDPLLFKPDTDFSYSTYGFTLLSAAMESAGGQPFLDLMKRELFDAHGLSLTGADDRRKPLNGRAGDYQNIMRDGAVIAAPFTNGSGKWAGGGFVSTPTDLARFGAALVKGQVVGPDTLKMMYEPRRLANGSVNRQNCALGVRVDTITDEKFPGKSWRAVHHGGVAIGAQSMLVMFPDQDVVVAISTNASTQPPARGLFGAATSLAILFAERQ
jgi:CubicO group peptidase (beta-lactamase class C family)